MANSQAYFGFRAARKLGMNVNNAAFSTYEIASAYATSIYAGDPVKLITSGYINVAAGGDTQILGIFRGCQYVDGTTKRPTWSQYYPASQSIVSGTKILAFVEDDPNTTFIVQCNNTSAVTQAIIGANCDFAIGTGSSTTGNSGAYLDVGASGGNVTSSTANYRILRFWDSVENDVTGAYVWVEVLTNEHAFIGRGSGI